MAQINWVFLDDFGGRHKVGLYHGDRTGHVMIHCNLKVMQVDFSVKESKMYSFFIEDELIEVILDKQDGIFGYEFRVNKKVDTPRNRDRKQQEGRNRKSMGFLIGGLVLVLGVLITGLICFGQGQEAKRRFTTSIVSNYSKENMQRLSTEGKRSVARLHLMQTENGQEQKISYVILAVDSLMEQGDFGVEKKGPIVLPNGFPFSEGDEFEAIYLPSDPKVHRVEFFQPARSTISRYINLALMAEQMNHPAVSREKNLCRVLTVAENSGWSSLAHFVFQEKTPDENARFNQESYFRMLEGEELAKAIFARCTDK